MEQFPMTHVPPPMRDSGRGRRALSTGLAALASVLLLARVALAAPAAGTIEGVVKDEQGRPVQDAQIRVQTPDGKIALQGSSGPSGGYRFTGLDPASYRLLIEKGGFEIATATVTVSAQAGATTDISLVQAH